MKYLPIFAIASLAGCATASPAERAALLDVSIACATADADIAALEAAHPSSGERARSILQSATPVGVVTGAATRSYADRASVAIGKTGSDIEARIAEIKQQCPSSGTANQTKIEG
tara:strand:- start:24395 stop:24739 length:345 start_codon:yes stop_codon:yes gene_type:complete